MSTQRLTVPCSACGHENSVRLDVETEEAEPDQQEPIDYGELIDLQRRVHASQRRIRYD